MISLFKLGILLLSICSESLKVLIPLDSTNGVTKLSVNVPQKFRQLDNPPSTAPIKELLEFVPEDTTNPFNWSEIITVSCIQKQPGFTAKFLTDFIKKKLIKTNFDKIIKSSNSDYKNYPRSRFIVDYTNIDSLRHEILYCDAYDCPTGITYVQYTVRVTDQMPEEVCLAKIHEFAAHNVELIENS